MAKRKKSGVKLSVLSGVMFVTLILMIFLSVLSFKKEEKTAVQALPVMKISLVNTTLTEIQENGKDVKYGGNNLEISDNGVEIFYDDVEIKGRGNFSWMAEKKSYRIKFDGKVNLLGMGKKKKWALIANSVDNSLMRNDLAYYVANLLGEEYQPQGRFVELLVDDEDLGVYYLIPSMEVDKLAVDLKDSEGVLVELDNVYCKEEEKWWVAKNGDCLTVKDVVTEDLTDEVMEEFVTEYNDLLVALRRKDFEAASEIVDMESFARYFLISEFAADPDAYATSWYFYKNGADDKIHAGPVWDFDAAFGNLEWGDWPEGFYDAGTPLNRFEYTYEKKDGAGVCRYDKNKTMLETINISWVMCDFLEMPEFRELTREIYERDFRDKREVVKRYIYLKAQEIGEFARKDAEKWGKGDFDAEVWYLMEWVEKRFELLDELLGFGDATFGADEGDAPAEMDEVEPESFL